MSDEAETLDLRQYLSILQRWLWLIVLGTLLAGAAAYVRSKLTTPIYEASTTLLISEGQKATGPDYNGILMSERLAKTYSQMMAGKPVLGEVEARLGISLGSANLTVTPVRDTQLIRLQVRDRDANRTAAIANAIAQVFIEQNGRTQSARFAASMESLNREMQQMQLEAEATQRDLDAERANTSPDDAELARLQALLAQYRATYASLLQSYEDIRVAEAKDVDALSVFEVAAVPARPALPRTRTNTLIAAVAGAMLAVGAALVLEHLDDTVRRPEDVERATGLPTFATIVRFPKSGSAVPGPLVASQPSSGIAEAYRVLRTNLEFAMSSQADAATILLVTSAVPREGKTTTLANLGVSLALSGKRVLLVDSDLRRPMLHEQFGLTNHVGLTTLYSGHDGDPLRIFRRTALAGLRVLTSGPLPSNPAEMLDSPQTAALLERLRPLADYVILDSPPALSVADASILAQKADAVLVVAEVGRTRTADFKNGIVTLQGLKASILGVVLNKLGGGPGAYYSYYYYYRRYDAHGSVSERRRSRRESIPAEGGRPSWVAGSSRSAVTSSRANTPQAGALPRHKSRRGRRLGEPLGRWLVRRTGLLAVLALLPFLLTGALLLASGGSPASSRAGAALAATPDGLPPAGAQGAPTRSAPDEALPTPEAGMVITEGATSGGASEAPGPGEVLTPTAEITPSLPLASATAPGSSDAEDPLHGLIGRLRLRVGKTTYAPGERVPFVLEIENPTDFPVAFGLLGLRAGAGGPIQVSWPDAVVQAHAVFTATDRLTFPGPGTYVVTEAISFVPSSQASHEGADWQEFPVEVPVEVH